ncbi:MAG: preprotein translocase subunit SecA [Alphaproteobacteria bacterium]|jgi:preprotein translocase subunit SecA|nr:preprotein translocase subunit SecA [Alphaproteobacteria bacterium]
MIKIKNLFYGNPNEKILKKYLPIVAKVNSLESTMEGLTDSELKQKTTELKDRLKNGETLNKILPEAFAVVREASKRVLGLRHFDVQLMGGITLHNTMIAEMLTGEGKTLVSTLPAYLNALDGKGVHIITVNDYLAKRDSQNMGRIFKFLGLSVGLVIAETAEENRQAEYLCDITYGTNNEFGFDYLRDNMKLAVNDIVQRPFNYAIVDEIDSILIDEARTPLIISGASDDRTEFYKIADGFVKFFTKLEDFEIDEKHKTINLTEKGLEQVEKLLSKAGLIVEGSLFDPQNIQLYHFITQALRSHHLFKKEVDYIVKEGQVVIIDEFTGRMMDGRRFSDGLHQALEAKEGLKVRQENQTLASITYQNYFKMYPKLAGMTGTAMTEQTEFVEIYGLKVVSVPSHKPVIRKDVNDEIYLTYKDKEKAIVNKVAECHERGQPVLIGTVSIEKSEGLSKALTKAKIPHNILNAKHHEKEAFIIAQAGKVGAITIATNMAGRGTDIQLGGNADMLIQQEITEGMSEEDIARKTAEITAQVQQDKEIVAKAGGLCVIGTERHESRRIDNQLRGRSGRQGEPGSSKFYICLEDDLMRIFGSNKLEGALKKLGFKEGEAISHPMISKAIEKAQKKVEQYNFEVRKNLLKFDNVINEQRQIIYEQRKQFMLGQIDIMNMFHANLEEVVDNVLADHCPEDQYRENWQIHSLKADLLRVFNIADIDLEKILIEEAVNLEELQEIIINKCKDNLQEKVNLVGEETFKNVLKDITLQLLDNAWKRNLLELDYVRGSINLRAYANKDPFNEYQKESFYLFTNMLSEFKEREISVINHLQFRIEPIPESPKDNLPPMDFSKVGRNDPCPCGSGKKFKQCHGK